MHDSASCCIMHLKHRLVISVLYYIICIILFFCALLLPKVETSHASISYITKRRGLPPSGVITMTESVEDLGDATHDSYAVCTMILMHRHTATKYTPGSHVNSGPCPTQTDTMGSSTLVASKSR
jgi:hypothetical protein